MAISGSAPSPQRAHRTAPARLSPETRQEVSAVSGLAPEEACRHLESSLSGLTQDEAESRLETSAPTSSRARASRRSCRNSGSAAEIRSTRSIESRASAALIATTIVISIVGMVFLHLGRQRAWLHPAALVILAAGRGHAARLRGAGSSRQSVVRSPLGHVTRRAWLAGRLSSAGATLFGRRNGGSRTHQARGRRRHRRRHHGQPAGQCPERPVQFRDGLRLRHAERPHGRARGRAHGRRQGVLGRRRHEGPRRAHRRPASAGSTTAASARASTPSASAPSP